MTIIKYLANSLGIKTEDNKVELINLDIQKMNEVEDKEYNEINLLIDIYINTHKDIKITKTKKTIKKEIIMNHLNQQMNKRNKKQPKNNNKYYQNLKQQGLNMKHYWVKEINIIIQMIHEMSGNLEKKIVQLHIIILTVLLKNVM